MLSMYPTMLATSTYGKYGITYMKNSSSDRAFSIFSRFVNIFFFSLSANKTYENPKYVGKKLEAE